MKRPRHADPTLLLNGTYSWTRRYRPGQREPDAELPYLLIDGNNEGGQFPPPPSRTSSCALGRAITVTRTYDSRNHCPGDFGYGWTLDVDSIRLETTEQMGDAWSQFIHVGSPFDPSYYRLMTSGLTLSA